MCHHDRATWRVEGLGRKRLGMGARMPVGKKGEVTGAPGKEFISWAEETAGRGPGRRPYENPLKPPPGPGRTPRPATPALTVRGTGRPQDAAETGFRR